MLEQHFPDVVVQPFYIEDDLALLTRYATRIPVLKRADGEELDWPFETAQLQAFISTA